MTELLLSGPADARCRLLLAHGAGAQMDSPFMNTIAQLLADRAIRVARFEFDDMASRRTTGRRRPPPRAETLVEPFRAALADAAAREPGRWLIGGKSMGGRVASLAADGLRSERGIAGLVCLGYPFHPPAKPAELRIAHLRGLETPALIVQGERDPFGTRAEVEAMGLAPSIRFHWAADGDHDLGPRGGSGHTRKGNLAAAADAIAAFVGGVEAIEG